MSRHHRNPGPVAAVFIALCCAMGWCVATGVARAAEASKAAPARDPRDWWSLTPLRQPVVPAVSLPGARIENAVDAFILARLAEQGLRQSPEANRGTLIRRLYFDLTGLPPTPAEVTAFVQDSSLGAYERLVDQLLASPHYGERWARHWLDVVHFGETHGYDKDQPRPNAWPYRDYVIRALNNDKPYARFLKEQVAGDRLYPGTRDGFEALGFIAAGPWDLIGHAEVPESKLDGKVARHLDRDDMVTTTIQTFNSLTIQCAQCHNHKFDPITQEEYYSLQAVFAAVDRADQAYDIDPSVAAKRRSLQDKSEALAARKRELDAAIVARAGKPLLELDECVAAINKATKSSDAMGYHSSIEKGSNVVKWVQVDLGRTEALQKVTLHPCKDDFAGIGEGFGFPVRYKVELSQDPDFKEGVTVLADRTDKDQANPKIKAQSIDAAGRSGRYLRVTATQLVLRQNDFIFALAELGAYTTDGRNAARGTTVTALDSIEAPVRWQRSNLTDGWYPGVTAAENGELAPLTKQRQELLNQATTDDERAALAENECLQTEVKESLAQLPPQRKAYIGAVHKGGGAFTGTGANGGKPRTIRVLARGSIQGAGKEVGPATLNCLSGLPGRFELPADHAEGERRAALAEWLASPANPLTWRSIVNRVWQYHFGRGLVETPNDFGHMGAQPTHPELLDWLAAGFRDSGQSLKSLHKLLVMSATYRQQSGGDEAMAKIDTDNRYLWRMNRRKLEAEAVRDAVLSVSGALNLQMEGPSFQDFVVEKPEHSPHYEYRLHDPADPKSHRRSVYRFTVRSQQQPFMTTLDCADPSMQVGRRNESVSPLQALALLNNGLMLEMSKRFGMRLEGVPGGIAAQVQEGCFSAIGRAPTPEEAAALTSYAREHGLTNLCRVLFNLNEFSFVD